MKSSLQQWDSFVSNGPLVWVSIAILSLLAIISVVAPLIRARAPGTREIEFDKAVYRARLTEIGRDRTLGRVSAEEADAAIAEEGRKLIALAKSEQRSGVSSLSSRHRLITAVLIPAVPLLALGLYLPLGNPGLEDQALATRQLQDPADKQLRELMARAEAHLAENPDDTQGWTVLAPIYMRQGRFNEAAQAWGNVLRLAPDTPEIRPTLGEAMVAAAQGVVTQPARALFEEDIAANPSSMRSRFYLALALGQEGRHAEAVDAWNSLIGDSPLGAPWLATARDFRARSASAAGIEIAESAPGPSREQIEAVGEMEESDRLAMIDIMVERLAAKLDKDPTDKEGWQRLIRAYLVQEKKDEAKAAIETALSHNGDNAVFRGALESILGTIEQQAAGE